MRARSRLVTVGLMLMLAAFVGGCSLLPGDGQTDGGRSGSEPGGEPVAGSAVVDTVEALLMESFPIQVRVVAKGNLPDGCTEMADWTVARQDDTFVVTLPTVRPADAACTMALVPFDVSIPLDVEGLAAGVYTVDVNGVTATFEFAVDNVRPPEDAIGDRSPCEAQRAEGEAVLTNPSAGYCLRFPADFTMAEPEANVIVIHGPDYSGGGLEPLSGFVNIQAWEPVNGRTLAELADEVEANAVAAEGVVMERADTLLGGVAAVEVIGVPGQRLDLHVVAIQNDRVIHLVFSPMGEEAAEAVADMEVLYQSVMDSFTFLPAGSAAVPPPALASALFALGQKLGRSDIAVRCVKPAQWSDSCLALAGDDETCAEVVTPGYVVIFDVADETYVYHADEAGGNVRLASSP